MMHRHYWEPLFAPVCVVQTDVFIKQLHKRMSAGAVLLSSSRHGHRHTIGGDARM